VRIADGDHELADLQRARVAERRRAEVLRVGAQDREIG
jgi:hypothetical protein